MSGTVGAEPAIKAGTLARNIIAGGLATLAGVPVIVSAQAGEGVAALCFALSGALFLLLTTQGKDWRLRQKVGPPGWLIVVLSGGLFLYGASMSGDALTAQEEQRFAEIGVRGIAETRAALQAGDIERAERAMSPIRDLSDPRIKPLKVALQHLKDAKGDRELAANRLVQAGEADAKKKSLYSAALADLDPERAVHEVEEDAANAAYQARLAEKEQENARLAEHFSKWDGSHPAVVAAVKASMTNPDSFKHVETTAKGAGNTIIVTMTYRGTNGFGAVVTERVVAKVDADGNLHGIARAE